MKLNIRQLLSGGSLFIFANILSNFINFVFNAYLGRVLTVVDFGLLTFINTLVLLSGIFINAYGSSVNHRIAYLITNVSKSAGLSFFNSNKRTSILVSVALMILWVAAIPLSAKFFNIGDIRSLILFTPVFFLFINSTVLKGFLMGNIHFLEVSAAVVVESLSKLIYAIILVSTGNGSFTYLAIPLSLLTSYSMLLVLNGISSKKIKSDKKIYTFPRKFFVASAITGLSTSGFLTLDLILVKHYLLPSLAGEYSLLSLAGKMIFFFGSLFNGLILVYVSRDLGEHKNPIKTFYKLIWGTISFVLISYVGIGILGEWIMPIAFGPKVIPILPFIPIYAGAIALFTLASAFTTYHLVRHQYSFSVLSLLSSSAMIAGIFIHHAGIGDIVGVIWYVSLFNFIAVAALHVVQKNGRFMLRNLIDLANVFSPLPQFDESKKRVLIFNWRDTKHKFAGGAEVYVHELAKRWVKMGYSVTLFCGNDGTEKHNETVDGVHVVRRGGFYTVYFWAFIYYITRFRGRYNVILDCQNGIPFFTPLYAREKIYCLMFHVHQEVFFRTLPRPLAIFASILENRLMPWAYKKKKFITISESSKQEILDLGLGRAGIEIVSPGIDLTTYKPGSKKSEKPLVAYVGRLQYYKSVDVLINAAKKIIKEVPSIEIVIAGDGEEKRKLEKLTRDLGLGDTIKFLGRVSEEEKISLYQKAWVAVNPSLKEGWGITTIEANACGTPVVASDVPGLRDSVKNPTTGYLVEYGDWDQFSEKILHVIGNKSLREEFSKNSVQWAANFEWNKSAEKYEKIIF
ncbi:MAG TPA: glycosyltransferase [Patescibacteria group bacterium]|nr:glycosyltransferase [Patescibacteria group bacterium]